MKQKIKWLMLLAFAAALDILIHHHHGGAFVLATLVPIYAGPGKLYYNNVGMFPADENGEIKMAINQEALDIRSGMHGFIDANSGDVTIPIDFTPLDRWGLISTLYPASITTPAPGTRFGGAGADVNAKIWTPDGRLYNITSAFVSKQPDLHLGVGSKLFGPAQLTGLLASGSSVGTAAAFYTITASGAADPGGTMALADFIRERWTGAWGVVAGFGGDGGNPLEAEEEWVISFEVKYTPLKVQKLTRAFKLDSVKVMAKCRPYGPTQAQIDAALLIQATGGALGRRFGATAYDLTLTSAISAKTITLKNAQIVSAGYEFGGTKLGNGEIGFIACMTFSAGAANAVIVFSA